MKKQLYLIVVIALLASLLPAAALAAKPAEIEVQVRNQTGAPVDLSLTDADGNIIYQTLPAGNSTFDLTEGRYTYFAATLCGNQSGPFNAVKDKLLFLTCEGTPVVLYENCQYVSYDWWSGEIYDAGQHYRYWRHYGYPHSYEWYLLEMRYGYGQTHECLYGLQPGDYWDGVKPGDTKPNGQILPPK